MAPRKRKALLEADAPAVSRREDKQDPSAGNEQLMKALNDRLKQLDAAVEERCDAIMAAADGAVAQLMQELKMQLLQLPKKVRNMPYNEYLAMQVATAAADPGAAAAAAVDSKFEQMQQQSEAAATAAPTTRSLRSRARSATTAAGEPQTVRVTRSRQPVAGLNPHVPAAADAAPCEAAEAAKPAPRKRSSKAAAQPTDDTPAAGNQDTAGGNRQDEQQEEQRDKQVVLTAAAERECTPGKPAGAQPLAAAAASGALPAPSAGDAAQRAAAAARVDAKLAAIGVAAAGTSRAAGGRTALRAPQPGEACFSQNGSPLSIHPNITRDRGRTAAAGGWPAMTPAVAAATAAAAGGTAAMGCITLIKKPGAAAGVAAATGRAGRSRTAAAKAAAGEAGGAGGDTAMVVMTDDGRSFTVDGAAGGLDVVPDSHREEVAAKLRAIQALAARALGV